MSDLNLVWTVIYAGSHGVDVSVYRTEMDAIRGAAITMLSQIYKIEDPVTQETVRRFVAENEEMLAIRLYSSTMKESFEIEAKPIWNVSEELLKFVSNYEDVTR